MNPHRLTWSFAFAFPFAAIVGLATIVGVLFWKEPKRIPWTPLTVIWLLFVAWMCFTTLFALVPHDAYPEWERAMKIQLMAFLTIMLMGTRERLNALVWVIVLSIGFYGVKGGIFTILTGGRYMVWGPEGTFISGNTSIALALVMILPLMRYLQLTSSNRWLRYGLGIAMGLTSLAVISSYSRGAFLAVLAMGLFLLLKSRRRVVLILALLLMIPMVYSFMPDRWFERMQTIQTYEEDASALGRINAWWFAFNVAKERPIVGGGYRVFDKKLFYQYAPDPEDFHDAHSIYFEVLGEHGFVGLGLFLALGFLALRTAARVVRETKTQPNLNWARDLVSMLQVSMIGYAVGGAFLGLAYFDLYYHLIAIIVLTQVIIEKALREKTTPTADSKERTSFHGTKPTSA
jgi:probable O-glycosylation ligase (exosortase A-associated)